MTFLADIRDAVGSFADRAVDLTLPLTCAGCHRAGTSLCGDCRMALAARLAAGRDVPAGRLAQQPGALQQIEWCGSYDGITRRALERLGDAGERRVSEPLGTAIANRWALAGTGGDALIPVPAPADRVRDIGYDHAALLARVAGRRLGLPVVEALRRVPAPDPDPRFEVVPGRRIFGRSLVLVDDVVTTGATLATCAAALMAAGATAVSAIAVAWDQRQLTAPRPVLA